MPRKQLETKIKDDRDKLQKQIHTEEAARMRRKGYRVEEIARILKIPVLLVEKDLDKYYSLRVNKNKATLEREKEAMVESYEDILKELWRLYEISKTDRVKRTEQLRPDEDGEIRLFSKEVVVEERNGDPVILDKIRETLKCVEKLKGLTVDRFRIDEHIIDYAQLFRPDLHADPAEIAIRDLKNKQIEDKKGESREDNVIDAEFEEKQEDSP